MVVDPNPAHSYLSIAIYLITNALRACYKAIDEQRFQDEAIAAQQTLNHLEIIPQLKGLYIGHRLTGFT